jgi:NADPH2:quinone reductase
MRAWRVHEVGNPLRALRLEDVNDPIPPPGHVVIDVQAASIGFPDLLQVLGRYQTKPRLPFTPGRELCGIVSAIGAGVRDVAEGDRVVTITGEGLAEKAVAPAELVVPVPDAMTSVDAAACLVNYGTALLALRDHADLKDGETLLVTAAAGGVGTAAVQLGRALGATVLGVAGGAEKLGTAIKSGAHEAFDYRAGSFVDVVRNATGGRGVDVCVEPVGGAVFDQACASMGWGGRLLVVGFASGDIPTPSTNHLLLKGYSLIGVNAEASLVRDLAILPRLWTEITALFLEGRITPVVPDVRSLERAPEALADLANRATVGKVVLVPSLNSHQTVDLRGMKINAH